MTEVKKVATKEVLVAVLDKILALPVEARKAWVVVWRDYLHDTEDPVATAERLRPGREMIEALGRGEKVEVPQVPPAEPQFDPATMAALVAIEDEFMQLDRAAQYLLVEHAGLRDTELTEEGRISLIRGLLGLYCTVREMGRFLQ